MVLVIRLYFSLIIRRVILHMVEMLYSFRTWTSTWWQASSNAWWVVYTRQHYSLPAHDLPHWSPGLPWYTEGCQGHTYGTRSLAAKLRGKCAKACKSDNDACCNKHILERQPDFAEQKSLVQETIEAAGHLCLFLPKFHCELNFIEFFWGMVKKFLCDNCEYNFETLKENLPKALDSVHIHTICKWEHQMYRWIEAYKSGLRTRDAQALVRKFSSTKYKSHRRIPEAVARAFD